MVGSSPLPWTKKSSGAAQHHDRWSLAADLLNIGQQVAAICPIEETAYTCGRRTLTVASRRLPTSFSALCPRPQSASLQCTRNQARSTARDAFCKGSPLRDLLITRKPVAATKLRLRERASTASALEPKMSRCDQRRRGSLCLWDQF
ncbi:hypothetical protein BESB_068900 [Besnoitia besnoiti]|uniref:Uncharacterized protein n=1 Tax=Besnoitia besnoiti TaxID=94643 RepID=A0A2A9MGY8_BESBE|nr:hypothetical protein BESB_068900 [Besnoitia besnoiti]PFH34857.1 hypothetical protein BESB_068900 [Besnoitia besnoiti]